MKIIRMLAFALLGAAFGGGYRLVAGRPPAGRLGQRVARVDRRRKSRPPTTPASVVLLVNTASLCGFTSQYKGLEELWRRYKDQGLVVLGVPSNDFGGQEPGSNEEIKRFCEASFDVTFPLADKQVVSGPNAHPLYRWAAAQTGAIGTPNWNFHKILIGRDGRVIDWFSAVSGTGPKLDRAIEAALTAKG